MDDQIECEYSDGDVVWVKLGSCWWPGEVIAAEKLPADVLPSFRKPPIAVVKFFQEDTYEYVKNGSCIYKYDCSRKTEFIKKGLDTYRIKHGPMEKFPEDVIRAETATGGDIEILTRDEFQEEKKKSYAGLFGTPAKKIFGPNKRGRGMGRPSSSPRVSVPLRKVDKTEYKVHILVQASTSQPSEKTLTSSCIESNVTEENSATDTAEKVTPATVLTTTEPASTSLSGVYSCHACPFTTSRLNVMILHNKTHSATFTPYTPSPASKKVIKSPTKLAPNSPSTPKVKRPRKEKSEKITIKKKTSHKRAADGNSDNLHVKKSKIDEEIKTSLLADWDDGDDESNDEPSVRVASGSPELPVASESPAVPTHDEMLGAKLSCENIDSAKYEAALDTDKPNNSHTNEKPDSQSDSKYEFCEDEDWPIEADAGRKIPRIKKPSIRKEETKSLSLDDKDVVREVAELLSKTTVPELPSVPEPLKIAENFPEPPILKTPDKKSETEQVSQIKSVEVPISKPAIFKTKTFFRSRHSRSQDAIGKYVAEQLNAERIDMSENEINGLEIASSPEARESPPVEPIKVARLAPKIQLKKMKAEAAQLWEKEKNHSESSSCAQSDSTTTCTEKLVSDSIFSENQDTFNTKEDCPKISNLKNFDSGLNTAGKEQGNKADSDKVIQTCKENTDEAHLQSTMKLDISVDVVPEVKLLDSAQPGKMTEQFLTESTVSAVDALLSVSRESDRVTKVISHDLPEDLFEDDNKDNINHPNGYEEQVVETDDLIQKDINKLNMEQNIKVKAKNNEHIEHDYSSQLDEPLNAKIERSEPIQNITNHEINSDAITDNHLGNHTHNKNEPSECDLQIAEALINLPSSAIPGNINDKVHIDTETMDTENISRVDLIDENKLIFDVKDDIKYNHLDSREKKLIECVNTIESPSNVNDDWNSDKQDDQNKERNQLRFETEQEKSENLNAAQSLVQMSESIDHNINLVEPKIGIESEKETNVSSLNNNIENITIEEKVATMSSENTNDVINDNSTKFETTSSKLLKILEEPIQSPKLYPNKKTPTKQIIIPGKEKILNYDVNQTSVKGKHHSQPKQKIIIRRTGPTTNLINSLNEIPQVSTSDIILSPDNKSNKGGSSVQTYTIKTAPEVTSDNNTIIIQQKLRKIAKTPPKLCKSKQQPSLVTSVKELKPTNEVSDSMFDINSMPIVLSDDILTPENIEKMPMVMSDGNIVTNPQKSLRATSVNEEKLVISTVPPKMEVKPSHKPSPNSDGLKTLLMNPMPEPSKVSTPNILSKSSKLRNAKPMLVIDKSTGKRKIIMAKSDTSGKEMTQIQPKVQAVPASSKKTEKFIIFPTGSSSRSTATSSSAKTQKIVIGTNPQTGKAHVLVAKATDTPMNVSENKPVSAKLIASTPETTNSGNTVMIITNAQGAQSRIVLTPEHEKILFPNKQQPNVAQLKTVTHRISTNVPQKPIITAVSSTKPTKIVPKQKSAIITSKGQLIVGGRVTSSGQNIAPMPEMRPAPKRIVASEPKKLMQTLQKTSSEPLIFLQQKSGAVMQLTAAQFEHLQRTGQIIQKAPPPENKIIVQKSITIPAVDSVGTTLQKQRIRRQMSGSPNPAKRIKQEIVIAPAPPPVVPTVVTPVPTPPLVSLSSAVVTSIVSPVSTSTFVSTSSTYSDLQNIEELLPSTAIVRQEPTIVQPEPVAQPPLSDGQLLAVPGEHFGGPPGSFYLCVEDNGTLTPIDNRPLVLENNQLVPMAIETLPALAPQPERRDILEAALANSDVFHADSPRDDTHDFRDLNANVSVHCRVSETSTTLNQPIMTPVEVPTKADSEPTIPSNLEDGLAVIGVTPHSVPTSLELPITVTDPRIAPKTTHPLCGTNYGTTLLSSPNTELAFVTNEETKVPIGPISMPILTDDESIGKSMPILTDEVITESAVSSVESTIAGSPASLEVRESENEDGSGGQWSLGRRLLTPGSDTSETSSEIPLQPPIQLSTSDLSRGT